MCILNDCDRCVFATPKKLPIWSIGRVCKTSTLYILGHSISGCSFSEDLILGILFLWTCFWGLCFSGPISVDPISVDPFLRTLFLSTYFWGFYFWGPISRDSISVDLFLGTLFPGCANRNLDPCREGCCGAGSAGQCCWHSIFSINVVFRPFPCPKGVRDQFIQTWWWGSLFPIQPY